MAESDLAAGVGRAGPCLGVRYNTVFQLKLNKRTKLSFSYLIFLIYFASLVNFQAVLIPVIDEG